MIDLDQFQVNHKLKYASMGVSAGDKITLVIELVSKGEVVGRGL